MNLPEAAGSSCPSSLFAGLFLLAWTPFCFCITSLWRPGLGRRCNEVSGQAPFCCSPFPQNRLRVYPFYSLYFLSSEFHCILQGAATVYHVTAVSLRTVPVRLYTYLWLSVAHSSDLSPLCTTIKAEIGKKEQSKTEKDSRISGW